MLVSAPCKNFTICHALLTVLNIITRALQLYLTSLWQNLFLVRTIHLLHKYTLAPPYQPLIIPTDHSQPVQGNPGSDPQMKICDKKNSNFKTIKKHKMFTDVYQSFDNTSKEYTTTTLISGAG